MELGPEIDTRMNTRPTERFMELKFGYFFLRVVHASDIYGAPFYVKHWAKSWGYKKKMRALPLNGNELLKNNIQK